ncbi:HDOD domain-containing protein [Uliginosibacterium sp. H3]|uniref:HDOD domain-containing protein n=1 Tax=Uliginosibacterium silvisoli TaxID=3114758 RepID=A0ABU6K7G4_9RHOO|nr:HDOD domain-containing protein [Uliginosibacterium sp. H3]
MHVAQELVASLDKLASLPSVYYRVRQALDDPDISLNTLSDLIGSDPALSAALLRLANSAFYGYPRRIETISRAISLAGLEQVGDVILASSIAATFGGIRPQRMDMARFWRGSVRCALLCRGIAQTQGSNDTERHFLLGLLADMGHLVMYHAIPDLSDLVMGTAGMSLEALATRERQLIGCDFAEVGAALAQSWRMPVSIGATVGEQLHPESAGEYSQGAAVLNIVRRIDEMCEAGASLDDTIASLPESILVLGDIETEELPSLIVHCEAQLHEMLASLGIAAS